MIYLEAYRTIDITINHVGKTIMNSSIDKFVGFSHTVYANMKKKARHWNNAIFI